MAPGRVKSYVKPPTNPYRAKLLSITLGQPKDHPTKTPNNYWDKEALHAAGIPEHAAEEFAEDLEGMMPSDITDQMYSDWIDEAAYGD